jgi:hypothetical protein
MRVMDVAPNEAPLVVLADRLEEATWWREPLSEDEIRAFLDVGPDFLETAKSMLSEFLDRTENSR